MHFLFLKLLPKSNKESFDLLLEGLAEGELE